jgi:hypothetical protein
MSTPLLHMNDNIPSASKEGSLVPTEDESLKSKQIEKSTEKTPTRHPISYAVSSYVKSMRSVALTAGTAVPHTAKWLLAEREKAAKRVAKFIPGFPDAPEETKLELKSARESAEFMDSVKALQDTMLNRAPSVLLRALFTQIFSEFDAFTGKLLTAIYLKNDSLLKGISREISLCDLLEYADLDSVKRAMLEKEIDSFRRDSYVEQFASLEKKFSLTLRKFKEWGEFVELSQRRNLFTHNGGIVSDLLVCDREGYKFEKRPAIGDSLSVNMDYFRRAIRLLSKVALMLGYTLWAKVFPSEQEQLHESLNDILYSNLEQKRWRFVAELHDFALSEPMKRGASEINLRIRLVNIAIALKFSERGPEALSVLQSVDWSAAYRDFKLAIAVLDDKFEEAASIMRSIGKSGEVVDQGSYHTWPLFTKFREQRVFYEAYQEIYGESFAEQVRREVAEKSTHIAATDSSAFADGEVIDVLATATSDTQVTRTTKNAKPRAEPKPRRPATPPKLPKRASSVSSA